MDNGALGRVPQGSDVPPERLQVHHRTCPSDTGVFREWKVMRVEGSSRPG